MSQPKDSPQSRKKSVIITETDEPTIYTENESDALEERKMSHFIYNEDEGFQIGGARFLRSGDIRVEDESLANTSHAKIDDANTSLMIESESPVRSSLE